MWHGTLPYHEGQTKRWLNPVAAVPVPAALIYCFLKSAIACWRHRALQHLRQLRTLRTALIVHVVLDEGLATHELCV